MLVKFPENCFVKILRILLVKNKLTVVKDTFPNFRLKWSWNFVTVRGERPLTSPCK